MRPLFHPTFGSRPAQIVGREELIEAFMNGLDEPIGSKDRCSFFIGQRGMGKTALLLELADQAEKKDYVVARVTAYDGMPEDIIETIQRNGAKFIADERHPVKGFEAGAFGFSFGLTFSEESNKQYGFRTKLTMLCDKLAGYGKGILILVDEARTSEAMRQLAITYQHLVGEEKNIALAMAGLPQAVSNVLNDDVLTFLNRASKHYLTPINTAEINIYYAKAFAELGIGCDEALCSAAAEAARGFPYLMQLIGYYLVKTAESEKRITERSLKQSIAKAKEDMGENVFLPILKPLSDQDIAFLRAMAEDDGPSKSSDLCERLGKTNSYIQPYRARMIEAGIIESPRKGILEFAVPYLSEYLRTDKYSR